LRAIFLSLLFGYGSMCSNADIFILNDVIKKSSYCWQLVLSLPSFLREID